MFELVSLMLVTFQPCSSLITVRNARSDPPFRRNSPFKLGTLLYCFKPNDDKKVNVSLFIAQSPPRPRYYPSTYKAVPRTAGLISWCHHGFFLSFFGWCRQLISPYRHCHCRQDIRCHHCLFVFLLLLQPRRKIERKRYWVYPPPPQKKEKEKTKNYVRGTQSVDNPNCPNFVNFIICMPFLVYFAVGSSPQERSSCNWIPRVLLLLSLIGC